ncbi:MAG: hypothetical protein FWG83_02805 [Oscillospiraceae bacterium]|nr:hypothetical protein [Oscillospiraceae bacterium]
MPRPIVMTDEMKSQARSEFDSMLDGLKMSDGELRYNCTFNYDKHKAAVLLTLEAYRKIVALVTEFGDEVAWHGAVVRNSDTEFIIEDIFVYPQEVTGSTVNTDQEEYTKWLYEQTDEVFDKIRMQGHSHVNMGVSPSNVDENHRKQILEQLEPEMFYIFQIWNKSLSVHTLIYDMKNNILYENNDIEVKLLLEDGMDEFLDDAKSKVLKRSHEAASKRKSKHSERLEQVELEEIFMLTEFDQYDLGGAAWRH